MEPFWFRWLPSPRQRVLWNEARLSALLSRLNANTDETRNRLVTGSAAIHDFTTPLLTDSESEDDEHFVQRTVATILGATDDNVANQCRAILRNGGSRERAIFTILLSPEFASTYIDQGRIVID